MWIIDLCIHLEYLQLLSPLDCFGNAEKTPELSFRSIQEIDN